MDKYLLGKHWNKEYLEEIKARLDRELSRGWTPEQIYVDGFDNRSIAIYLNSICVEMGYLFD